MKCRSCLPLVHCNIKQLAILVAYFLLVLGDDWATASKVSSANDASTGTITDMPPGFEKRPASCDEMLAQAVVLANEEVRACETISDVIALKFHATIYPLFFISGMLLACQCQQRS